MAATVEVIIEGRDNFSGVLGNFGSIITGIESAIRLAGDAFRSFTGLALEGLDAVSSYERLTTSLETLLAVQLVQNGVAVDMAAAYAVVGEQAEDLVAWTQELAIHSPFTQEGVAEAFRLAMAYGFSADEAQRLTQATIDYAAGAGLSVDAMDRIARAMGQINVVGHLMGQDMLQLTAVGVPVAEILAEHFGVTTDEIIKMREKGLLPAAEVLEALTLWMETNFEGAADKFTKSWAGLLGTFEDLKKIGLRELFGDMLAAVQPLVIAFIDWFQIGGVEVLSNWGEKLGDIATNVINLGLAIQDAGINSTEVKDILTHIFGDEALGTIENILAIAESIADLGGAIADAGIDSSEFRDVWDHIFGEIDEQMIVDWLDELDAQLAVAVDAHDWTASGDAFGDFIGEMFKPGEGEWSDPNSDKWAFLDNMPFVIAARFIRAIFSSDTASSIGDAIGDWLTGAIGSDWSFDADAWAADIGQGLINGLNQLDLNAQQWVDDHIINPIKNALGISSPSTVFMGIGQDIILGLMGGFASMISPLIALINNVVSAILDPFAPILNLLGIDTTGSGSTGSHTTTGTGTGTTTGTTTGTLGGTVVNQYFAGATINVGSWDEIAYDCIYPNPFIGSTGGQLGTGGPLITPGGAH